VAKPLPANVAHNAINETNICELIVDACINNTEIQTSTLPLEGSSSGESSINSCLKIVLQTMKYFCYSCSGGEAFALWKR
jgi:hypothetical protein